MNDQLTCISKVKKNQSESSFVWMMVLENDGYNR